MTDQPTFELMILFLFTNGVYWNLFVPHNFRQRYSCMSCQWLPCSGPVLESRHCFDLRSFPSV